MELDKIKKYFSSKRSKIKKYYNLIIGKIKKHFSSIDHIVFWVTIISFVWICFYKLLLTTNHFTTLLFSNADRVAEIVYTIFTSIVASGIFYFFTIYLPRYRQIKKMKENLEIYLGQMNELLTLIVKPIQNNKIIKEYINEESFAARKTKEKSAKNEFLCHYNYDNKEELGRLHTSYDTFNDHFSVILLNYRNILSPELVTNLMNMCNMQHNLLEKYKEHLIKETDNELVKETDKELVKGEDDFLNYYFEYLENMLRFYYELKDIIK